MRKLRLVILFSIFILPTLVSAQLRILSIPQGGTGTSTFPHDWYVVGDHTGNFLTATNTPYFSSFSAGTGNITTLNAGTLNISTIAASLVCLTTGATATSSLCGDYGTSYFKSSLGIATTSPWASLSVGAHNQSLNKPLFAVASSSTAVATTTHFLVTGTGNVGIGTVSPASLLHLEGGNADIRIISSSNYGGQIRGFNSASVGGLVFEEINNGVVTETFRTKGGNVGIGTTTPGAVFDIYGGNASAGDILFGNWSASALYNAFYLNGTSGDNNYNFLSSQTQNAKSLFINRPTGGDIKFREANGADQITLLTGGNVGIASTTPFALLGVENIGSGLSFAVNDVANDASPFVIDANGSVGIGTSVPGALLDVRGSAIFNEDGADADFRIESDTNANHFVSDAGMFAGVGAYGIGSTALSGNRAYMYFAPPTLSFDSNVTSAEYLLFDPQGMTINAGAVTTAASIILREPTITLANGGTVADAYTLNIQSAPTEGTRNGAFWVSSGISRFDGNVGVGTSTPVYALTSTSATAPQLALSAGADIAQWTLRNAGANLYFSTTTVAGTATSSPSPLELRGSGGIFMPMLTKATDGTNQTVCYVAATGELIDETTTACAVSSAKYKNDIKKLNLNSLDLISQLRPVSYSYNEDVPYDFQNKLYGFVAEEVAKVEPHLAEYGIDGNPRTLDDRGILALVVDSIQKILAKLTGMEKRLDAQEKAISELQAQIREMKK